MLKELLVSQLIPQLLFVIITAIISVITYYVRQLLISKKDFLVHQREELIQKIGIDKYNQDVAIARNMILAVEQMGKEFNWESAVKHAKATELIAAKTGLSADDIFNVIKSTVSELNLNK